ncbi:acyl--CoA ligase [Pseudomaricurvus alkylphenolicus]|uniref:class I adenylate-forming enzyme family protein n=1 Tax=Pseudomaricurvus alkylphenolicus TaxID=1306991 RepID=UPI00142334A7|nr:class I adenylate-forming enzyme family protein [Pseudomaricurvus alkylphenolicus]NIB38014.1 acyl--CoA ligase [Pseudomaricurvus alkylphenolicus]
MNIFTLLKMSAECFPDRIALTSGDAHISYGELLQAAEGAAERFRNSGCKYVSVIDVSSPAVPIALFGAAAAGLPYVPINYRLTVDEIQALKERIEPAYIVTEDNRDNFIEESLAFDGQAQEPPEDPQAIAVQLFTSGTTGKPKAAVLRHENLMSYILGSVEFASADEADASLVSVPPYHIAGISAVMSSIYTCRRLVQLPNFDPVEWLRLVSEERVTTAFVVPTMLSRIIETMESQSTARMPSLRAVAYGGGKMPVAVIRRALELFPEVAFTNAYGLTETSSTITLLGPDDHKLALASTDPLIRKRLGSVGKPLPTIEVQIRDDDGTVLGSNLAGEVYVRGGQVSGEYLERKAVQDDGWFPTRDKGYLDEFGYLYLDGRADDVIVRGGENISPGEIEDVLLAHDSVADACVVGIPDQDWGEAVAAAVVLKQGVQVNVDELQTLVREQMRSSRVPGQIRFMQELPYNDMGKLLRRVVKEQLSQ